MRFIDIPGHVPESGKKVSFHVLKNVLEGCGIEYLVTLPETPYELLLRAIEQSSPMRIIQVTREAEGMGICAGLTYGGRKAAWLGSYKGFYNSLDSLIGTARRVQASFLVLISEEPVPPSRVGADPEMGRYSAAICRAIEMPCYEVRATEELGKVKEAVARTASETQPVAVVIYW